MNRTEINRRRRQMNRRIAELVAIRRATGNGQGFAEVPVVAGLSPQLEDAQQ